MNVILKVSGALLAVVVSVWALVIMASVSVLSLVISLLLIICLGMNVFLEFKLNKTITFSLSMLIKMISLILSGVFTYYISNTLNPILSASLIGLIGAMLFNEYREAIYVGAFVGMSSLFNIYVLLLVLLIAAVVYILLEDRFIGIGGKLGFISFISTFLVARFLPFNPTTLTFTYLQYFYLSVVTVAVSILTYLLNKYIDNTTLSSSFIGLLLGVVVLFSQDSFIMVLCLVGYGATFIGMQTRYKLYTLLPSSLVFVYLYHHAYLFNGMGGLLGFLAFLSLVPIVFSDYLIKGVKLWKKSQLLPDHKEVSD